MSRTQQPEARLRRIYRRLSASQLSVSEQDGTLSLEDLGLDSREERVSLAFGVYSRQGLENALREYGVIQRLEERRVGPLEVRLRFEDPFRPRIVLWSLRYKAAVVDLALRKRVGGDVGIPPPLAGRPLLYLDSFTLQHPGRSFDWSRPRLPGQEHPGLALSGEILELLLLMTRRIGAEALALTPASFAAAWVYARHFHFVEGAAQGLFQALRRAGRQRPRWLVAWAVELGCVRGADGEAVHFVPSPMLAADSQRMGRLFEKEAWRAAVRAHAQVPLTIDFEALQERFPWALMPPGPPPEHVADVLTYDPLVPL
ncbi:deacetylase [Stigmatella sp. ncwal1]|uniref:Deacetylase n=1 Tax=Stigmatella ashevillensis TaxID=2995309 RepID=A0ABT5D181_9BACT|nr:deacetylase [Stigmatella ashevillena]MDC0707414.1 deacetylase [Stigmatella ashevillena]